MKPAIQRVNVDFSVDMLKELDVPAKELNISRQAVKNLSAPILGSALYSPKGGNFIKEKIGPNPKAIRLDYIKIACKGVGKLAR